MSGAYAEHDTTICGVAIVFVRFSDSIALSAAASSGPRSPHMAWCEQVSQLAPAIAAAGGPVDSFLTSSDLPGPLLYAALYTTALRCRFL